MLKKLKLMYPHQTLITIFMAGLLILAGSFIVEYVFKVEPCIMCLWQRFLVVGITITAFLGTLYRGVIKKYFLGFISFLAFVAMGIAIWQSLGQAGIVSVDAICEGTQSVADQNVAGGEALLEELKTAEAGYKYVDCTKKEDFFLYNNFGITLANLSSVIMFMIFLLSFYKLFFKPARFRRFNKRGNYRSNRTNRNNGRNNRNYRGSGYRRSHNRNRKYNNRNRRPNYKNNNNNNFNDNN